MMEQVTYDRKFSWYMQPVQWTPLLTMVHYFNPERVPHVDHGTLKDFCLCLGGSLTETFM